MFHAFEKGWTTTDYLLAHIIDAEQNALWQRAGDDKNPKPDPFPRPNDETDDEVDGEEPGRGEVQAGMVVATTVTVSEFMAMRAEREAQWRARHNIPEPVPSEGGP